MTRSKKAQAIEIARGIGHYLSEIEAGENGSRGWIQLGKAGGRTSDPAKVDAAADKLEAKLAEISSPIARLKLVQRIRNYRAVAERLREPADSYREHFVEHAAAWAEANGITYESFRELGVPADVLREAGIHRGS